MNINEQALNLLKNKYGFKLVFVFCITYDYKSYIY